MASLHYHEWLPNESFASTLVDQNLWMGEMLMRLHEKWRKGKLAWVNRPGTLPLEFRKLGEKHIMYGLWRLMWIDVDNRQPLYRI